MLGVRDRVADHALEEGFQDAAGFFVDHCGEKGGGGLVFGCLFRVCAGDLGGGRERGGLGFVGGVGKGGDGRVTY